MGVIVGVDTGLKGAIAVADFWHGALVAEPMPLTTEDVNGKPKRVLDRLRLQLYVREVIEDWKPQLVVIEGVHAMPKQGVVSTFTFGNVFGSIVQAFYGCGEEPLIVPASTWKRRMGLSSDKQASLLLAHKVFPNAKQLIGKHDGIAEAALLAYYGKVFCL
jgi:hypothetical protein